MLRAKEYILAGDTFQAQISRRLSKRLTADPFDVYRALRSINPSPYMFYLVFDQIKLVGASPEILVTVQDGEVTIRPIAGTRPRTGNARDDQALAEELLADEKERAEHVMLVDLGRNDIGRVAEYGSVKVEELMVIEKYSHVLHIVSDVRGKLRDGLDQFDVLRASFPAGTLTGAPKVRTMEIIDELEPERRGFYGGGIGYFLVFGQHGHGDHDSDGIGGGRYDHAAGGRRDCRGFRSGVRVPGDGGQAARAGERGGVGRARVGVAGIERDL